MTIISSLPYDLTNGTTADASQVMSDFNQIVSNVNANAAANGANGDITSLTGLTTPINRSGGGTLNFTSSTTTDDGIGNYTVATLVPAGMTLFAGVTMMWVPSATNTGAATMTANSLTKKNIKKLKTDGTVTDPAAGDIVSGTQSYLTYDGTQFILTAPIAGTPDTNVTFTDNTTGNVSTTAHGYAPKLPNDATKYFDGTGAYSVPPGNNAFGTINGIVQANGSGTASAVTIGTGLSFSGGTLSSTAGGGETVLLDTKTASSSASLDFISDITSSYSKYFFVVNDIVTSTSDYMTMFASTDNGSTWTADIRTKVANTSIVDTTAPVYSNGTGTTGVILEASGGSSGTTRSGEITIINPLSSTASSAGGRALLTSVASGTPSLNDTYIQFGSASINAIRLKPNAGTFTSGTVKLYGVKN